MFSSAHTSPRVELLPLKPALPAGRPGDVVILARIHPGTDTETGPRPPLNLSLVLDRSGSMQGQAIDMARKAAQTAIRALQPQDRVSVVTFDTAARPLIPPQLVRDPEALCRKVESVTASGTTALHAGWLQGATHVAEHQDVRALNRVLLLSDGQANEGETRPHVIAAQVRGLTERGVTTSTVGLGRDYQEDLMRAMADAGDGNYEHIEDAVRLPAYFEAELSGMTRTSAHTVSFGVEPNPDLNVLRVDVLNDLPQNAFGRHQLPNLIAGRSLDVIFTLHVPAQAASESRGVTRIRLAWTGRDGIRRKARTQLNLPVLEDAAYAALPEDPEVLLAQQLLENARAKRDAVAHLDAGDVDGAQRVLAGREEQLRAFAAAMPSPAPVLGREIGALTDIARGVREDPRLSRKRAVSQNYDRSRGKDQG